MRQSKFFSKTLREPPKDEESINAKLLSQAGFIAKLAAGVYAFLPLGLRVLNKIENIVREEMERRGGQEIFMPVLHPRENWEKTGRWRTFDALFKIKSKNESEYALGPTHEEIIYPLLKHYISSYKDLPLYLYQIQTKFRDEPRAKSGLLRCREFRMKDLYSFHATSQDRDNYYEEMRQAYLKIFHRLGLRVIETKATGGTFSELSQEFQVVTKAGEDTIFYCQKCMVGTNKELGAEKDKCPKCRGALIEAQAIEVGNIFPLKEKFSQDFRLTYKDQRGKEKLVESGCYGLGTSRAMGAIVEVSHDKKGIIWPENVSPFQLHLILVQGTNIARLERWGDEIYQKLKKAGIEVLYDDRMLESAGEKFADADLIGIPQRAVISEKTMAKKKIEIKARRKEKVNFITPQELLKSLAKK